MPASFPAPAAALAVLAAAATAVRAQTCSELGTQLANDVVPGGCQDIEGGFCGFAAQDGSDCADVACGVVTDVGEDCATASEACCLVPMVLEGGETVTAAEPNCARVCFNPEAGPLPY